MANYYVKYFDQNGAYKFTIFNWFRLEYMRKENDYGSLYLDLPPVYDVRDFAIDGHLEVWRKVGAFNWQLDMDTWWFVRLKRVKVDEQGKKYLHLLAYDAVHLIERRIVPYDANTAYTNKTQEADNMIKAIMRENFGSLATDTQRDLSDYLVIEADTTLCPIVNKEFSRRKVLPLLQEIADESTNLGTYLSFDVVKVQDNILAFRTYTGQRGIDRGQYANSPLLASVRNGVLSYASVAYDHSEERNYIYAGGRGEEDGRINATAYNDDRIGLSVWNRCEDFIDSKQTEETDDCQSDAFNRLEEMKPKKIVNGHIQQLDTALYGVHYGFGDIIKFEFENEVMDVHLNSIRVLVDATGNEAIEAYSRNLDETEY